MKTVSLVSIIISVLTMISCEKETFNSMSLVVNSKISNEYQVQNSIQDTLDIEFISSLVPDFERTAEFSVTISDNKTENLCKFMHTNLVIPANTEKFNNKLIIDSKKLSEKRDVTLNIMIKGKGASMLNGLNISLIPYISDNKKIR